MIYTIGHAPSYERGFELNAPEPLCKLGRTERYTGGSVWETREAAQAYLDSNVPRLSAYAVLADWERDTAPNAEHPFHDLLVDAPLVRLT